MNYEERPDFYKVAEWQWSEIFGRIPAGNQFAKNQALQEIGNLAKELSKRWETNNPMTYGEAEEFCKEHHQSEPAYGEPDSVITIDDPNTKVSCLKCGELKSRKEEETDICDSCADKFIGDALDCWIARNGRLPLGSFQTMRQQVNEISAICEEDISDFLEKAKEQHIRQHNEVFKKFCNPTETKHTETWRDRKPLL